MSKKEKTSIVPNVVAKAETLPTIAAKKKPSLEVAIADLDSFGGDYIPGNSIIEQTNKVLNGTKSVELRSAAHLTYLFADEVEKFCRNRGSFHIRPKSELITDQLDFTKAEHVVLNGTIVILLNGSTFNIRDVSMEGWDAVEVDWVAEGDITAAGKPLIVLHHSKVEIRWTSAVKGKSIISNSTISINGPLYLDEAEVKSSHLSGEQINIFKSTIMRASFSSKHVSVRSSTLNNVSMSAKKAIYIENYYPGGRDSERISGTPHQSESINIKPNHSLYSGDFAIPQYCRNREVTFDINVSSRLDYGRFSAAGTLKFVRCNEVDLLVGGVFIDSQKFEQVATRIHEELGEPDRGNYPRYIPTLVPYLDNARLSNEDYKEITGLIWELAIGGYLQGKDYVPDRNNKVQNTLILGLVEQISARINLYKQINFLVG